MHMRPHRRPDLSLNAVVARHLKQNQFESGSALQRHMLDCILPKKEAHFDRRCGPHSSSSRCIDASRAVPRNTGRRPNLFHHTHKLTRQHREHWKRNKQQQRRRRQRVRRPTHCNILRAHVTRTCKSPCIRSYISAIAEALSARHARRNARVSLTTLMSATRLRPKTAAMVSRSSFKFAFSSTLAFAFLYGRARV